MEQALQKKRPTPEEVDRFINDVEQLLKRYEKRLDELEAEMVLVRENQNGLLNGKKVEVK